MIELKAFSKKYGKTSVLEDINISLEQGKITFIMGPNGAGKTTLIKSILGLEGYEGNVYSREGVEFQYEREKCFVVWDDCPFYMNLSGLQNLYIYSENRKTKSEIIACAKRYLEMDLLKRKVKTYSYGQKKKLALVLIEVLNPEIIIMDEISNGLDFETMQELKKYLVELAEKKTVILTGHQFGFYNDIIDVLLVLKDKSLNVVRENFKSGNEKLEDIYEVEIHAG